MAAPAYPFGVEVDAPAPQNRLSVLLRIFYAIPHLIILYFLGIAAAVVGLIAWFAILFTGKYPEGLMSFTTNVLHWQTRYSGYTALLTDKYPAFAMGADDSYPVRLTGTGQVEGRNRLTTFFRYFMIIPHIIVLAVLGIVACVLLLVGWIVALFTGSLPASIHKFLVGELRWSTRVSAYASLLTDEYPPFSLN